MKLKIRYDEAYQVLDLDEKATEQLWVSLDLDGGEALSQEERETRMVGLDMHKAPNAVEQRKHEYHPCPPEKVEAIKDALRHFGLIAE